MRLDLREVYLGRVRERERRSSMVSAMDSWSEDVVVEGWAESGFVGILAGMFEGSLAVVEGEVLIGLGSVGVGAEVVPPVDAMVEWVRCFGELKILSDGVEGFLDIETREEAG